MENDKYILHVIKDLAQDQNKNIETLKKISSCLKNRHDITTFRQNSGLQILFTFIEKNYLTLEALKILAYCCTDNKTKLQILQWNSVPKICKLLKELEDKEELRVVCKLVATLCGNKLCRHSIHDDAEALECVLVCLQWTSIDDSFMSVHLKTIRLLSRSKEHFERMVDEGVVGVVCSLLQRNPSSVLIKEIFITINHFLKRWSSEVKAQFIEADTLARMVEVAKQSEHASYLVHQFVLTKLLPRHEILKHFGTSGVLRMLITSYEDASSPHEKDVLLRSIYISCSEASNRASTLHNYHFLDLILRDLTDPHCNHNLLLRTVIAYKYNCEAIKHLISHRLISSSIRLLGGKTSFNLPEITSKLLYATEEVANSVSVTTPLSPSSFNGRTSTAVGMMVETGSDSPSTSRCQSQSVVSSIQPVESARDDAAVTACLSSPQQMFNEATSEEEEEEEDFLEEDRHLFEMARIFELDRRNQLVFSRVSDVCHQLQEQGSKRKASSSSPSSSSSSSTSSSSGMCSKRMRIDSNFCLKSTLAQMVVADEVSVSVEEEEEEESTEDCVINLISHLVGHPDAEKHLNRLESIRTLIFSIPALASNHKLSYVLVSVSANPLYFKLLVSEMLLPMIDLFCTTTSSSSFSHSCNLPSLFNDVRNNLEAVCNSRFAPSSLQELLSAEHSRLQCSISLCYLARSGSKAEKCLKQEGVMEALVKSMYDHKHPLRLLAISSYCYLLSCVSVACECDVEEEEEEEEEKEEDREREMEREFDVSLMLGQECIRSVKGRLVQHSEVFRAMFEGAFREADTEQVLLSEDSPEAFHLFHEALLSGSFNRLLFEVDNADLLLQVLLLANKYLVRGLEGRLVALVCSNMPAHFEAVLKTNCFLVSRAILARCVLHVCQEVSAAEKYELIVHFFKYVPKEDFTELSAKLIKPSCIHNV